MSTLHLFFRDHTGTILTIITLLLSYGVIIFPQEWIQWLYPFFQLHGGVYIDGQFVYRKDIKDIYTVASFIVLLTVLRYFLCNTLFQLIAKWLKIEDTLEKPQAIHKTEVFTIYRSHSRSNAGWFFIISSLFLQELH